ncbi:hypothetical protein CKO42_20315 [Lamprobacter modestohalophilus]|uniref:Uncharacterized protein n=1 Tax=Lamprobacter modestohalophilus TaxID=1064514 RepID=A0A9X1B6B8_9GAMM|nr:hypothetical protein [Lamprobacter modestohalophilus]MBK1620731.1 hypothetical protein [Lamprobacter modestohalophilus]
MKRRTFIQSIGAAGVLGLGEQLALAKVSNSNASVQTLTPVVERLPEVLAEVGAEQHTLQASMAASAAERSDDAVEFGLAWELGDYHCYPLLIGLGARAEYVLDAIHTAGNLPLDAGLYRTGNQRHQQAPNWLAQRLQKTAAVVLLIDPDDPAALEDAHVWARYLQEADIDLKAALVLEAEDAGFDPSWRSELALTVIDIRAGDGGLETTTLVRALLPCLLFQQIALIGVDLADICTLIASGSRAWTTAVHLRAPDDVTVALARAFANLPSIRPTGAMVWVTSGLDYSLREFDAIVEALHQWTGDPITFLHAPSLDDRYADGERLLSLTLFSD